MAKAASYKYGLTLYINLATGYSHCAITYRLWPETGIDSVNALFHDLDFRTFNRTASFTLPKFHLVLAVFALWGFGVGTLYAWLH